MTHRRRRGSQAIEFAMIFPVLLAFTAGIVDYAWYFSQRLSMVDAARQGARAGAVTRLKSDFTPCQVAEADTLTALQLSGFPGATNAHVTTQVLFDSPDADGDGVMEGVLYVDVDIPYDPLWGLMVTPAAMQGAMAIRLEDQDNLVCGPL